MADKELEQGLEELEAVKQSFKANINNTGISTYSVEFRNMPNLINQMEKRLPEQSKTVAPTTSEQTISADTGYKLKSVKVNAVVPSNYYKPEEVVNVTPTTDVQNITPTAGAVFNQVNVSAVTSAIDANIKAENIKEGVTILGETGSYVGGNPDLIDVEQLPTENVEDNKIYRVVQPAGEYYWMWLHEEPQSIKLLAPYTEIFVDNIDSVTDPQVSTAWDGGADLYIYTDTNTYTGYVYKGSVDNRVTLAEAFDFSDASYNKGLVSSVDEITSSGIYYVMSNKYVVGVPSITTNKVVMEYLQEMWKPYERLTEAMLTGVWFDASIPQYLELKTDGTAIIKEVSGEIVGIGTYNPVFVEGYGNGVYVSVQGQTIPLEYIVTEDAVKLGEFVKQSEYVVSSSAEGSPKFGELVDGTLSSIEASDLAGITTIRNGAFKGLTALTTVVIPANITSIGDEAFAGCTSLTDITMQATNPVPVTNTTFPSNVQRIYVPSGSYYEYVASWSYYADKIVRTFDVEEVPNATGTTLNIVSDNYTETMNDKNGYTLEIGG